MMHRSARCRLFREARLLGQFAQPEMYPGMGHEDWEAYAGASYDAQMNMLEPEWMTGALGAEAAWRMDDIGTQPWFDDAGMYMEPAIFQAQQWNYMPYGQLYGGTDWYHSHPAWSIPSPQTRIPAPPAPRIPAPPAPRPYVSPAPRPNPVPVRPEAPRSAPSHPLDRGGRLAAAYAPFFNDPDPTVRAAAQRWWDQAVRILERHPNDEVIFGQLVRGASENLRRATTQHTGVAQSQREWEARTPTPLRTMRVNVGAAERDAGAIVIYRDGNFSERLLYYPHRSSPFWDMRSMDLAREWGIVPVAETFATGQYPRSVELRFYGQGTFNVSGVGGVQVPQSRVVIGASATANEGRLREQADQRPLRILEADFGSLRPRAIEIENVATREVTRITPEPGSHDREGIAIEDSGPGRFKIYFYRRGTYRVNLIEDRGGSARQYSVDIR